MANYELYPLLQVGEVFAGLAKCSSLVCGSVSWGKKYRFHVVCRSLTFYGSAFNHATAVVLRWPVALPLLCFSGRGG